ncbi:MAG TPA: GGDEF domain-containing protein [Acidobacteriota bacterium]|nr:GGDEF domain-containing protein [Acidobacteriota bacterium]
MPSANSDPLTGVANRRGFEEYANTQLAKSNAGEPLSLVVLDIDSFKTINDEIGEAGGDQLLRDVGQLLNRYALGAGFVARFGGDEFEILMRCSLGQASAFAEFLRDQISSHEFIFGAESIHITASLMK